MDRSVALLLTQIAYISTIGRRKVVTGVLTASVMALCVGLSALAQDAPPPSNKPRNYSPYPEKTFPNRVYFGDTHLHTSYSTDAGMVGNTAWAGRRLSLRPRRGGHVEHRPACEAAAAARLPRRLRPRRKPRACPDDRRVRPRSAQDRMRQEGARPGQERARRSKPINAWIERMNALDDPLEGQ